MNPWEEGIQQARAAALAILQPSESELEHGLALHRDAVVCESYSLGLQAPIDGEAVAKAVESGASEVELQYLSERMRMTRWAAADELKTEYLAAWEASGVTCSFQNTGEEGNDPMRMLGRLAHYTHLTDRLGDHVARAPSRATSSLPRPPDATASTRPATASPCRGSRPRSSRSCASSASFSSSAAA